MDIVDSNLSLFLKEKISFNKPLTAQSKNSFMNFLSQNKFNKIFFQIMQIQPKQKELFKFQIETLFLYYFLSVLFVYVIQLCLFVQSRVFKNKAQRTKKNFKEETFFCILGNLARIFDFNLFSI